MMSKNKLSMLGDEVYTGRRERKKKKRRGVTYNKSIELTFEGKWDYIPFVLTKQ